MRFLLEAAAIFLGVSLGFIADDYRERLGDRRLERESLSQLLQDLDLDSADVAPMIGQSQWLAEASRWVTNHAALGRVPLDSLTLVIDSINQTPAFSYEASSAVYSGLESTGRLDLIRDPELKSSIVRYFEDRQPAVGRINVFWLDANRRWWDAAAPHLDVAWTDIDRPWHNIAIDDPQALLADHVAMFRLGELSGSSSDMYRYATELIALNRTLSRQVVVYLGIPWS